MGVELVIVSLGRFGRWQMTTYIVLCIVVCFPSSWQLFAIVFIGVINKHHCRVPENRSVEETVPRVVGADGQTTWDQCNVYVNRSINNETTACTNGWTYEPDGFEPDGTIAMEWDLVCDKDTWVETSQTIFVLGTVIGILIFTPLSDRYGRKRIIFICQFLMGIFGAALAFSPNYLSFCIFQFLTGGFSQGLTMSGFVLACELFPLELRTYMAPMIYVFWATGMMALTIWAYFFRSWRSLQLAISIPSMVCMLYYWFCPESMRWLVAKDRMEEAGALLRKAARINGTVVSEKLLYMSDTCDVNSETLATSQSRDTVQSENSKQTLLGLIRSSKCRRYTLIMMYLILANNLMYFGLSLLTAVLPGDRYVNFLINSGIEIPATISGIILTTKFGRRIPVCIFHIISGVLFVGYALSAGLHAPGVVLTTFALSAKFGVGGSYAIELVYAQEIFPTLLRNTGFGLTVGIGFVGGVLAPYAVYFARLISWAPAVVFSVLSLIGAVLALFEVETHQRPLPTTIEEIERWPLIPTKSEIEALKERLRKNTQREEIKKADVYTLPNSGTLHGNHVITGAAHTNPAMEYSDSFRGSAATLSISTGLWTRDTSVTSLADDRISVATYQSTDSMQFESTV